MKILINEPVELEALTPEMVAEAFWNLDDTEQAKFYNHLALLADDWALSMQMQYLTDNKELSYAGRRVMSKIGDYSHWGLVPKIKMNPSTGKETVE
jgi:hypothetical protein